MSLSYSVVIPTHRSLSLILPLIASIANQEILPTAVIVVVDRVLDQQELQRWTQELQELLGGVDLELITSLTHDFIVGQGASYVRNQGIQQVSTSYILCIDDDNRCETDFVRSLFDRIVSLDHEAIIVPTELYRETKQIRSQGYGMFMPRLGWARPSGLQSGTQLSRRSYASSNCLFGQTSIFQSCLFPESFVFVYEDFAWCMLLQRHQVPLYVAPDVTVSHYMRDKTPLEESYIATSRSAWLKGRNRIRWVKLMPIDVWLCYLVSGFWLHTVALIAKILYHAPWRKKYVLIRSLLVGTRVGLTHYPLSA